MRKDYTDITVVLDRSGSMMPTADDAIGGFNTFLSSQACLPGKATISLMQFDNEYDVLYEGRDVKEAPQLSHKSFQPRGTTALLDAMGRAILATGNRLGAMPEEERPSKVLFLTITDGMENASREWTEERLKAAIKEQREKYSWDFLFIGAGEEVVLMARDMGIPKSMTRCYNATSHGTRDMYAGVSAFTAVYRSGNFII